MDQRTYIPNNRPRHDSLTMSRMQEDLSGSPHQDNYLEASIAGESPMISRTIGRIPHVCVVGAGVAGLRCADVLLQHGVKVTVLEGRDRVGGRLCQSKVCGNLVDLGPNWIHGTDSNPILDLAKETNTLTMTWDGRQSIFDHLGHLMPEKDAAENTELVWAMIEQAMHYSNESYSTIPASTSLFEFFEDKVQALISSELDSDEDVKKKRQAILHLAEMWGAFVGTEIQKQSLKYFWLEECIDGENLFVAETYHKVLQKIAAPALKGADVKFNHKIRNIVSIGSTEEPKVEVEIDGNGKLTFDEVVMTAPLGWLKRNRDAFTPELPPRLKSAIDAIGYGHLDKVYITFPTAFWNELRPSTIAINNSTSISHPQASTNVTATTAPHHQPLPTKTMAKSEHYPGFTHWMSPTYAHSTNPYQWNQECVNLAGLPGNTAHPTLLFYTFGPTSLYLASELSKYPSPSDPAAQNTLINFFLPYFSRLPNYDASASECRPTQVLATTWANDELAGYGSYANFQVGLENGDKDVEVMRRGLPERGLWLAGEHTAPFVALGTVTGAYWAGEGVAKRIARAWGLTDEGKVDRVEYMGDKE
ncbi:FAD/NAD(P)-binding domain-containing protein [Lojkania enalia]|uniref:FAD/NAD(P)-binding domain-containing protein n=1 Tax=Lojkania enalia TaxID=147567 RepID=A0A9P4KB70_9PLEO|nr:FAD/NAD(P)-binding domain-containing protein [Didymosphaeria enalia]